MSLERNETMLPCMFLHKTLLEACFQRIEASNPTSDACNCYAFSHATALLLLLLRLLVLLLLLNTTTEYYYY